jgi:hypothetical protein
MSLAVVGNDWEECKTSWERWKICARRHLEKGRQIWRMGQYLPITVNLEALISALWSNMNDYFIKMFHPHLHPVQCESRDHSLVSKCLFGVRWLNKPSWAAMWTIPFFLINFYTPPPHPPNFEGVYLPQFWPVLSDLNAHGRAFYLATFDLETTTGKEADWVR